MERFYLEEANIKRKNEAINYIKEHIEFNSEPAGVGGLDDEYKNYENWLEKMELMKNIETCPSNRCIGREYFLIRENDEKIVGMINLRWNLNEWMMCFGGHIGYGIRPTERRKGYNKINLYLCLLKAKEFGINKVLLTANDDNLGSINTIKALGGVLENKIESYKENEDILGRYWINVDESLEKYENVYKKKILFKE